ncbi:MAG: hypothetical protein DRI86_12060, partial [Bacteroidetes bacterium]
IELTEAQINARIAEIQLETMQNIELTDVLVKINIYINSVLTKYCYIIKSHYLTADAGNLDNYNSKLLLF